MKGIGAYVGQTCYRARRSKSDRRAPERKREEDESFIASAMAPVVGPWRRSAPPRYGVRGCIVPHGGERKICLRCGEEVGGDRNLVGAREPKVFLVARRAPPPQLLDHVGREPAHESVGRPDPPKGVQTHLAAVRGSREMMKK
jgi:hypothetical protein